MLLKKHLKISQGLLKSPLQQFVNWVPPEKISSVLQTCASVRTSKTCEWKPFSLVILVLSSVVNNRHFRSLVYSCLCFPFELSPWPELSFSMTWPSLIERWNGFSASGFLRDVSTCNSVVLPWKPLHSKNRSQWYARTSWIEASRRLIQYYFDRKTPSQLDQNPSSRTVDRRNRHKACEECITLHGNNNSVACHVCGACHFCRSRLAWYLPRKGPQREIMTRVNPSATRRALEDEAHRDFPLQLLTVQYGRGN